MKLTISSYELQDEHDIQALKTSLYALALDVGIYPNGTHESLIIADGLDPEKIGRLPEIASQYLISR